MKMLSKNILSGAIAGAVLTAGLAMSSSAVAAPSIADKGDLLLFPYYTTQNNFHSLIHLVNTGPNFVVAKVRYRDYENSNDALDFTVTMSPNDVFTGYVHDVNGTTTFTKTDNTCTSPNIARGGSIAFPASADSANKHTGHIEVIVEGVISGTTASTSASTAADEVLAYNAIHGSDGIPRDCAKVDALFTSASINATSTNDGLAVSLDNNSDVTMTGANVLTGHYVILDADGGVAGGARPLTIQDSFAPDPAVAATATGAAGAVAIAAAAAAASVVVNPCSGSVANLICGQYQDHWPFPNLASVMGVNSTTTATAGVTDVNRALFNAFETLLLGSSNTSGNEWSAKNSNGVTSEIVLTMPTKYLHRDNEATHYAATNITNNTTFGAADTVTAANPISIMWDDVDGVLGNYFVDTTDATDKKGCVSYSATHTDREEQGGPASGTSASGGTASTAGQFCNETTVLTYNGGVTNPASAVSMDAATAALARENGWVNVTLATDIPVIGHAYWKRGFGTVNRNYGHIMTNWR